MNTPPILVLCNARSGSTLLRYLLDTHPDIAAPPETPLGALCASLLQFAKSLPAREEDPAVTLLAGGRELIDAELRRHAESRGKKVWLDKSVATVDDLDAVQQVFPDARYICLYRHAMDSIASGLEASRWGFARYGFRKYVQQRPHNTVAALAQYWIERTSKTVAFERTAAATHRVRYEDLCARPEETLKGILEFLELPADPDVIAAMVAGALRTDHDPGPGDYKIDFSSGVVSDSVGTGRAIPAGLLEPAQLKSMNRLLTHLAYETVESDWNTRGGPTGRTDADHDRLRRQVADAMSALRPRLAEAHAGPALTFEISYGDGGLEHWSADPATADVVLRDSVPVRPPTYRLHADVFTRLTAGALTFESATYAGLVHRTRPDENQESDRLARRLFAAGTGGS
ncbi:protein-tyrosine sulfotransferase [Catenulispora sp. MAP12-49]|uniref:sulfotransferase family protein n=1 Tax=Catenulispora sp. MAP12-49 TaxID=3156302 RepID=UPI003519BC3D